MINIIPCIQQNLHRCNQWKESTLLMVFIRLVLRARRRFLEKAELEFNVAD